MSNKNSELQDNKDGNINDVKDFVDTLFKLFCSFDTNLVELYNFILLQTNDNSKDIQLLSKEDIVDYFYIDKRLQSSYTPYNDVSFLIKNNKTIILLESQTLRSRYMPLRMMMYYCDLVEKYMNLNNLDVHTTSLKNFTIPEPEFYVLHRHETRDSEDSLEYIFTMNDESRKNRENPNPFLQCKVKNITISDNTINNIKDNKSYSLSLKNLEVYNSFAFYFSTKLKQLNELDNVINFNTDKELSKKRVEDSWIYALEQIESNIDNLEESNFYVFLIKYKDGIISKLYEGESSMVIYEKLKVLFKEEGWEEGREEGREEGKEQGREEEREEGIMNLIKNGFDTDTILKIFPASNEKDIEIIRNKISIT